MALKPLRRSRAHVCASDIVVPGAGPAVGGDLCTGSLRVPAGPPEQPEASGPLGEEGSLQALSRASVRVCMKLKL